MGDAQQNGGSKNGAIPEKGEKHALSV
jgi:hypothetical protein